MYLYLAINVLNKIDVRSRGEIVKIECYALTLYGSIFASTLIHGGGPDFAEGHGGDVSFGGGVSSWRGFDINDHNHDSGQGPKATKSQDKHFAIHFTD